MERKHKVNPYPDDFRTARMTEEILNSGKFLALDMDNTIIQTLSKKPFPEDLNDFVFVKGFFSMLQRLVDHLKIEYITIITNQNGCDYQHGFPSEYLAKVNFVAHQMWLGVDGLKDICHWIGYNKQISKPFLHNILYEKNIILIGDASGSQISHSDSDFRHAQLNKLSFIDINNPLADRYTLFKGEPIDKFIENEESDNFNDFEESAKGYLPKNDELLTDDEVDQLVRFTIARKICQERLLEFGRTI